MSFLKPQKAKATKSLIENLKNKITKNVEAFGAQYTAFGIFGVVNYPCFYLIWSFYDRHSYENFGLRLTATILCLLLLLRNCWPNKLKPWLPIYWCFTLLFCLPFFFFFMLFKNHGSSAWLMSSNTIIFWLPLMVDWESYVFIFIGGVLLAFTSFAITTNDFNINLSLWWGVAAQFVASFIVVLFFARKKQLFDQQKIQLIESIGASIAHELRTPLRTIHLGANGIREHLSNLFKTYKIAQTAGLEIPHIDKTRLEALEPALESITLETNASFNFIDMLLTNINISNIHRTLQKHSIKHCIEQALLRYPFDLEEKNLIQWDNQEDFEFMGDELLLIHVLFNLLKNALYYIRAARKGNILIWLEKTNDWNYLYFKDTGSGISPEVLAKIFDKFFSNTRHGTGIGLAFCKAVMESFKGKIACRSTPGEFTEFVLAFPKLGDGK